MLVALDDGVRCEAFTAVKSKDYRCPECGKLVHVRRRKNFVTHFYHLVAADCASDGEGKLHLAAKHLIGEEYKKRNASVDYEWPMSRETKWHGVTIQSLRRTDVMVRTAGAKGEKRYAIEIQDSHLADYEFRARCVDWEQAGAAILWMAVPRSDLAQFLREKVAVGETCEFFKYSLRPFEREILRRTGEIWFVEPDAGCFFRAEVKDHMIYKENYHAFDPAIGDFRDAGGYSYKSARWVDLVLSPAIRIDTLQIDATRKYATWRRKNN